MSDILHEALKNFRSDLEPFMKAVLSQFTRTTTIIMDAYDDIINSNNDMSSKREDAVFLAELRHHHDIIIHSVTHELDALQTIGQPRKVERYFNFEDGECIEVDKQHFVGLPDENDDNSGGVVHSYNAPVL